MQYAFKDNVQGICPVGWHLPIDIEWMMLEVELGMSMEQATSTGLRGTDEGAKLKAGGSSGFEALLGGYCNNGGQFNSINIYATFFTSSQGSQTNLAWTRYLFNDKDQVLRDQYEKTFAYSVRCLKD